MSTLSTIEARRGAGNLADRARNRLDRRPRGRDLSPRPRERYGPAALLTGASEAIGPAFARVLAAAGLGLVLVARRESLLQREAQELRAVPALTCAPAPRLIARRRGGLVLLSSPVAFPWVRRAAHDAATKAHVHSLAKGPRPELAPVGGDATAAAPGPVHSGFVERAGMAMGVAGTPEVVARAPIRPLADGSNPPPSLDVLFVRATIHGLAAILRSELLAELGLTPAELAAMPGHVLTRIGSALRPDPPPGDHAAVSPASGAAPAAVSRTSRRRRDASKPPRPPK